MTLWHENRLSEQHNSVLQEDVTVADLVRHYLERIQTHNPNINALVHVDQERAVEQATRRQEQISAGTSPRLVGLPTADKDLVARAGMPTGYGSATSRNQPVSTSSDPMASWLDSVGAISVGKSATSEFGLSGSTESPSTGPTRNPHDLSRSAGGSSGGAAAAVAAGLLPFAPGSDGGGSIRIPAFACGVVGWKPSRGLVPAGSGFESTGGLVVPGLVTRSVDDLVYVAEHLVYGAFPWSSRAPGESGNYRQVLDSPRSGLTVGVTVASPWPLSWGVSPDGRALQALELARSTLADAGHTVVDVDWKPDVTYAENFMTLWAVAAASVPVAAEAVNKLEPLTRFLRERGRRTSAVELAHAQLALRGFERDTIVAFSGYDAVLTPGLNGPAPKLGWLDQEDAERNFRQQVNMTPWTSFVNVAGLPALAVPVSQVEGLPLGVQLVGRPGGDATLMGIAHQISDRLPEAQRWPEQVV